MNNEAVQNVAKYIISFLLEDDEIVEQIEYEKKPTGKVPITIIASDFFDDNVYLTKNSLPKRSLLKWHDCPILYGTPQEIVNDGKIVIYADIVASTFFMISRYEELIRKDNRDKHNRFSGVECFAAENNFLERPIVDEYTIILKEILHDYVMEQKKENKIKKVYLTHDVDVPWMRWSFLSALRNCIGYSRMNKRLEIWPLKNYFGDYSQNPFDTFDFLIEQDNKVKNIEKIDCEIIYFLVSTDEPDEYTESYIEDKKVMELFNKLEEASTKLGLHLSYNAGYTNDIVKQKKEKMLLENRLKRTVVANRNHFLLSKDIDAFEGLIDIGITDDYTMGYADRIGFRLGTSKNVNWINPKNLEITKLILHPLIIMECSLHGSCYMNLNYNESLSKISEIYNKCKIVNGNFSVLFHNSAIELNDRNEYKKMYEYIIDMIVNDN